uniref:Uncharacterized protein n=1 Tax=Heterorhabditis bacteriophora TaxID=37862 RepID=A0A1I7X5D6_HETBA
MSNVPRLPMNARRSRLQKELAVSLFSTTRLLGPPGISTTLQHKHKEPVRPTGQGYCQAYSSQHKMTPQRSTT